MNPNLVAVEENPQFHCLVFDLLHLLEKEEDKTLQVQTLTLTIRDPDSSEKTIVAKTQEQTSWIILAKLRDGMSQRVWIHSCFSEEDFKVLLSKAESEAREKRQAERQAILLALKKVSKVTTLTTGQLASSLYEADQLAMLAQKQAQVAANRLAISLAESAGIKVGVKARNFTVTLIRADMEIVKQSLEESPFYPIDLWDYDRAPSLFVRVYGRREGQSEDVFLGGFKGAFFQDPELVSEQKTKE